MEAQEAQDKFLVFLANRQHWIFLFCTNDLAQDGN